MRNIDIANMDEDMGVQSILQEITSRNFEIEAKMKALQSQIAEANKRERELNENIMKRINI